MYVAIRHSLLDNEISVVAHSTDIRRTRELCDISINRELTTLNVVPEIIYARKFSVPDYKQVIVYRIGYELLEGYVWNEKKLINDDVYSYKIFFIGDKKYYQTPFTHVIVDDMEKKNVTTTKKLPDDLLESLKTKNKSELL